METPGVKCLSWVIQYIKRLGDFYVWVGAYLPNRTDQIQCDKAYTQKVHLKSHEIIYKRQKPFVCSKCDKTFKLNGDLKMHERTHTREKPFDCSECDKAYTQNVHLKSHEMIHTGEKSFACSKCDKTFKLNGELKMHESYPLGRVNLNFFRPGFQGQ